MQELATSETNWFSKSRKKGSLPLCILLYQDLKRSRDSAAPAQGTRKGQELVPGSDMQLTYSSELKTFALIPCPSPLHLCYLHFYMPMILKPVFSLVLSSKLQYPLSLRGMQQEKIHRKGHISINLPKDSITMTGVSLLLMMYVCTYISNCHFSPVP